jgi:hypothetical protein
LETSNIWKLKDKKWFKMSKLSLKLFSSYGDLQLLFWSLPQKSFLQLFKFQIPKVEKVTFFLG